MMTVAMAMPIRIDRKAFQNRIWRREAIRAPVQAPVPGRGMPTKIASPQNS